MKLPVFKALTLTFAMAGLGPPEGEKTEKRGGERPGLWRVVGKAARAWRCAEWVRMCWSCWMIELNRTELNWTELNSTELNWIEFIWLHRLTPTFYFQAQKAFHRVMHAILCPCDTWMVRENFHIFFHSWMCWQQWPAVLNVSVILWGISDTPDENHRIRVFIDCSPSRQEKTTRPFSQLPHGTQEWWGPDIPDQTWVLKVPNKSSSMSYARDMDSFQFPCWKICCLMYMISHFSVFGETLVLWFPSEMCWNLTRWSL